MSNVDLSQPVQIEWVRDVKEIDQEASRSILIHAFSGEYSKYLTPEEVDPKCHTWRASEGSHSVETFYSEYFDHELKDFNDGHLLWFQARVAGQVVGFSTFEKKEDSTPFSAYMNLLAVDPNFQGKGIGKELVFIIQKISGFRPVHQINVLLRKKNQAGKRFYSQLNFHPNPSYVRADNFVDLSFLESWSYSEEKR